MSKVTYYPRFALISPEGEEPEHVDVCDNCRKEWKRGMLAEVKDIFQRVEPGGPMPSGECPGCGSLCYPADMRLKEWLEEAAWVYPEQDAKLLEFVKKNLTAHFGEECKVWQNESHIKSGKYPQYFASADPRGYGGDICQLWRDGQTWWPMAGDYSCDDMMNIELILRESILECLGRVPVMEKGGEKDGEKPAEDSKV